MKLRGISKWLHNSLVAAIALLTLTTATSMMGQSQSGFTYNGLNLASFQANEYLNATTPAATAMRSTGANYGAVVVTQYVQTSTSNTIAPETASSPGYTGQYPLSPTDAAVVSAIQSLQAQGLVVSLKPHVDSLDGVFRGNLAPSNPAAWFASYQTFILHYAQIASQNNVGMLVIGTEFASLTGSTYKANWETIISALRTQYPGLTLVYAANATSANDEFTTVSFWADLDLIGVDGYFPLTNQNDPTVSALVSAWTNNSSGLNIVAALKALATTYNKPLIFTEIGYVSVSGTNKTPYASLSGAYDGTEQQSCYEAFFQVFSAQTSWMKGVFWWNYDVAAPGTNNTNYTPQTKPAGTVTLPKWFGNTTPGFTIAPALSKVALGQSQTMTDVISVTTQAGFSGAVTLGVAGLPTGVTASFTAGPAPGTQNLVLTSSSAAVTGGPVNLTVTGTSGATTATTVIAFTTIGPSPGFSLSPASKTVAVTQANTAGATDTINIVAVNGFSSSVVFSVTGLPTGVTAYFAPNPATGSTAALTLFATATAPVTSNVVLNITGTSGSLSSSTTVTLAVNPSPSFSLAASPSTISLPQSTSTSSTVTVTNIGGFTGAVTLSATGLPAGVSATFTAGTVANTQVVKFTASSSATPGPVTVTINGISASGLTASAPIAFTVVAVPNFTFTGPDIVVHHGTSVLNSSTVTIAPTYGFTGTVALSCTITPVAASNPAVCSLAPASVTLSGTTAQTSVVTVSTTAGSLVNNKAPSLFWTAGTGTVFAMLFFVVLPRRRRTWPALLTLVATLALTGVLGCDSSPTASGASIGTPVGAYTVVLTGTSGSTTGTGSVNLIVQ